MSKNIDGKYQNMIIDNSKLISDIEKIIEEKLADYVKFTDYAKGNQTGVFKTGNGTSVANDGLIQGSEYNYSTYSSKSGVTFISKTTLENVIAGKGLDPKSFTGYDAAKTQTLKNIEGTLTWVDDEA